MKNRNLERFINETLRNLEYVRGHEPLEHIWDFNCSLLGDEYALTYCEQLSSIKDIHGPVLYWFEIVSDFNPLELINTLAAYAEKENNRATPLIRKNYDEESKCLYVGKVKKNFFARVIQHLGHYKTEATQGLQLCHWTKETSLKIKLHAIVFEQEMEDMMPVIEQYFANTLKPLLGKHI